LRHKKPRSSLEKPFFDGLPSGFRFVGMSREAPFLGFPCGFFLTRPFSELCSFEHYSEMHMARPRNCRYVERKPHVTYFKPRGIPMTELTETLLTVEGLEALRLADLEGLTTGEGAERMRVSRHTFGRTLAEARRAVADALVNGRALCIEGGTYAVLPPQPEADKPHKEFHMQKVAVSSEGPSLDDMVDPRFGRAGGFVIVNPETMETSYLDNGASQTMAQGAGIETAERMSAAGVTVVLSGYVGPKAFEALKAAGIKVCQDLDGMTVREAVEKYKNGDAPFADAPNK